MPAKDEDILNKVMSHYTVDINSLEEENRLLKETVHNLKDELSKFHKTPLLVAYIRDLIGENALLRLNNGNEFFVDVSNECNNLVAGDTVLVEQKNLTIVKKIDSSKKFNVEQFVIVEKPTLTWDQVGGLRKQAVGVPARYPMARPA